MEDKNKNQLGNNINNTVQPNNNTNSNKSTSPIKIIKSKLKSLFKNNFKMKLLVTYIIANLLYITLGSYIFITKEINAKFDYKQFSLGLRNLLVLNILVFLVICLEKRYKKNWAHIGIVAIGIIRSNNHISSF